MADSQVEIRRSKRDRKPAKPITTVLPQATRKRKRGLTGTDTEDDGHLTSDPSGGPDLPPHHGDGDNDEDQSDNYDGDGEEYRTPKAKPTGSGRKSKAKAKAKDPPAVKGKPPAKRPRTAKATTSKPTNLTKPRKARKAKEAGDAPFNAEEIAKDTKINADNPLFNAIMNPSAALQGTVEDFLESLDQDVGTAQAELINLILRSCGCNDSVNSDEVVDYDGVVDALDTFTEGLKKDDSPTYPLTSKLAPFKKFRAHLSEFISRLITSAADMGSLYTTDLVPTLQTWVIAMSSSQIRSFRHTATVVALEVEAALCDVAKSVEKEVEVAGRQREGEKKRRTKGGATNGKGAGVQDKGLETKMKEVKGRLSKVEEFLGEIVDGVFVHRYRDTDAMIRTECITSLAQYFKRYPSHFLSTTYLRYVGWVLSDKTTPVRLAAVKSLQIVYSLSSSGSGETDHLVASLNHFTERFKPRLLEMAEGDTDVAVRVGVLGVLEEIDKAGLLEEDDRERLGALIYSEEARVRKAVGGFVRGVWEEWVEERMLEVVDSRGARAKGKGKSKEDIEKTKVGIKGAAVLLVRWGTALDKIIGDEAEGEDNVEAVDEAGGGSSSNASKRSRQIAALAASTSQKPDTEGRTALAIEALWDSLECVRDWEGVLNMLLLDHSSANEDQPSSSSRGRMRKGAATNGRKEADQTGDDDDTESQPVNEAWRLEEVEEALLLEVLVASLNRTEKDAMAGKKSEDETIIDEITRALIKALPRFFIKYQTDENRISEVLVLPTLMNLDLYLEMRMTPSYATLWDDVNKQFVTHTSPTVLSVACKTLKHMMNTTSLSNTNSTKILELEDELSSTLRDTIAGRDELEVTSFNEDEVLSLTALTLRLRMLAGMRDMTGWMEEDEGGKQSSAWDILSALVERGRLGYKEEESMIEQGLHILWLHIMWKALSLNASPPAADSHAREIFVTQRESLVEKLIEFAVGTQSNTCEGVKRTAFQHLLAVHILFVSSETVDADGNLLPIATMSLVMEDEVQYRCAGYIQAELEAYAERLAEFKADVDRNSDHGSDNDSAKSKKHMTANSQPEDPTSRENLAQGYVFFDALTTFLRAIRVGAIHVSHGSIILAHYGRLGESFDKCTKIIVDVLREEGLLNNQGDLVENVIIEAMSNAYTLVLEDVVEDEANASYLAKALSPCFVLRGNQLSIVRRIDAKHIVQIQVTLLSWIGKHLTTYQSNGNKRAIKKAIGLFRTLVPLLSQLSSRDALRIKAHLDQVLAQAKVEPSPTQKHWEPLRAYEKRLGNVMAKEKGHGSKRKGAGKGDKNQNETTDEESEVERLVDDETDDQAEPRPRPKPRHKKAPSRPELSDLSDDAQETEGEPVTQVAHIIPTGSLPRPRPRPKSNVTRPPEGPPLVDSAPSPTPLSEQLLVTPQKSRKRPRDPAGEEEAQEQDSDPEATPPGDIQIRRKRVRH